MRSLVAVVMFMVGQASVVEGEQPKTWAVLIGVSGYRDGVPVLPYADDDAVLMRSTLRERGWIPKEQIVILADAGKGRQKPTRANVTSTIQNVAQRAAPEDRMIVFFAGHGVRSKKDGATYLLPIDVDLDRLRDTAVPIEWVRQSLDECAARDKVLIIDACHSGNASVAQREPSIQFGLTDADLEDAIQGNQTRVYTLASCQAGQSAIDGGQFSNGLFSAWLCKAISGLGDDNSDARITADEAFTFVHGMVPLVARRFNHEQTPGRIVPPKAGNPVILELKPESYAAMVRRIATLLHEVAVTRGIGRLGVMPFTDVTPRPGESRERLSFSPLDRELAGLLENHLITLSGDSYALVDSRILHKEIAQDNQDLFGDAVRLRQVGTNVGMDAYVTGQWEYREQTNRVRVVTRLNNTNGQILASSTSFADVDAVLQNRLTGKSYTFKPKGKIFPDTLEGVYELTRPKPEQESAAHPLTDSTFPYRVLIRSNGRVKPMRPGREPNELVVDARPNEQFEIEVVNDSKATVFVRLFINGRNVLGNKFEDVHKARSWVFPEESSLAIEGWHHQLEGKSDFDVIPFVFVNLPRTRGLRRTFGENVGRIDAYFYKSRPMAWVDKLGVGGLEARRFIKTYSDDDFGDLCIAEPLALLTLRYVRAER